MAAVAVSLFWAPLLEELVFRGGLQEWLLRRGHGAALANGFTAVAFTAAHALTHEGLAWLALLAPAIVLGALYNRTRSLACCIAAHSAMNGVWLLARSA